MCGGSGGHCGRCWSLCQTFMHTHTLSLPSLAFFFFFFFFLLVRTRIFHPWGLQQICQSCSLWSKLVPFRTCQPVNLVWVDYRKLTCSTLALSFPPSLPPPPHSSPASPSNYCFFTSPLNIFFPTFFHLALPTL